MPDQDMSGAESRVRSLFESLASEPPRARRDRLDVIRATDPAVCAEVESLLQFHDRGSELLDIPDGVPEPAHEALARGTMIGRYRIVREIGHGAMGVVYEAEQDFPSRRVALKLIRPELVSPPLLRRFSHEAEALALLQHPSVAQLFEAGFADADGRRRPFMAMELVEGSPITDHARSLDTRAILGLMAGVCDAVEHAHRRGVIHRDLKPSNIVVTAQGIPKVLDFGVARLTASDPSATLATSAGQIIGTLGYMSPEQFEADPRAVDTRCDVYSLGAVLYELLTGRTPIDARGLSLFQVARAVHERDPMPIGRVDSRLRGEVDAIVSKALDKEPGGRYQSAADLGADLRRFLANEPIAAKPATTLYQMRKFARRHRTLVGAASVLLLTIVVAGAISMMSAVEANRAARRAHWQAYLASIGGADSALQLHDVPTAEQRLLAVDEADRRNWEWRYLVSRLDQSADSFGREHKPRSHIEYSPDGRLLATAASRYVALLWDNATRSMTRSLGEKPEQGYLTGAIRFNADGTRLLTTQFQAPVRLWDVRSGEELAPLEGAPSDASAADWSGDLIALGFRDGHVGFWSAATGTLLRTAVVHEPNETVRRIRFSPDGGRFATTAETLLKIWDTETGRVIAGCSDSGSGVVSMAWHPDGARIAAGFSSGIVRIWSAATGTELVVMRGHQGGVWDLDFPATGEQLVTGGADRTVRFWVARTGEPLAVLHAHHFAVVGLDWSPDGRSIATVGSGPDPIHVWRADAAEDPCVLDVPTAPYAVAFAPNGNRLFVGSDAGRVHVLDAATGQLVTTMSGQGASISRVTCSGDGRMVASSSADNGTVWLWDARALTPIRELTNEPYRVIDLAFNADSTRIAVGMIGPDVKVWDTSSGALVHSLPGHGEHLWVWVAFDPGGRFLASGTQDGVVRLWDAETGRLRSTITADTPNFGVRMLAFAPDGRLVSAHLDGCVRVWDPRTGGAACPPIVLPSLPTSIAFGGEGGRLFIGTSAASIHVLDWPTLDEVLVLRGLASSVAEMVVCNGTVAATDLTRLRVWRAEQVDQRAIGGAASHAPTAAEPPG